MVGEGEGGEGAALSPRRHGEGIGSIKGAEEGQKFMLHPSDVDVGDSVAAVAPGVGEPVVLRQPLLCLGPLIRRRRSSVSVCVCVCVCVYVCVCNKSFNNSVTLTSLNNQTTSHAPIVPQSRTKTTH